MRRLAMFALASTMAACSVDSTGPSGSVAGSYSLRTINGSTLPYTLPSGLRVMSDDLTLYQDGTYEDISRYDSGTQRVEQGSYTSYNGAVTFESDYGDVYDGSVSGNVLTEIVNGYTQVFQRN
jgi:hypothetical protein